MRINKYCTEHGFCSRREADRLIQAGQVKINGRRASLGDQVEDGDEVTVNGQRVGSGEPKVYIMYHKPIGITCTTDKQVKGNIISSVRHPYRVFPIGRLDKDSSGLIFLTNDGGIVNNILRSQYGHEKEYVVRVHEPFPDAFVKELASGVNIGGYVTKKCSVKRTNADTFTIVLTEGKNRQIRRMCESLGYEVTALHRIRIMNIHIGSLKAGEWKDIPKHLFRELKQTLDKKEYYGKLEEISE